MAGTSPAMTRKTVRRRSSAAGHRTFLIQLCGSAARPYWISISFLRSPMATGPAAPPLMRKSPLAVAFLDQSVDVTG